MESYTVYMHITPNNKRYVGITSGNVLKRWGKNGDGYNTQLFGKAVKKYGWENISHIVIATNLSYKWACQLEKLLIVQYDLKNPDKGYNLSYGGEGPTGVVRSDSTKEKLRQINLGRHHTEETKKLISEHSAHYNKNKKWSYESRQKLSNSLKGKKAWNKGKKLSEEQRLKMSLSHIGKSPSNKGTHLSDETKQKISAANVGKIPWNKGVKMSDEQKQKLREANLGKKLSEETRRKMSEAHKKIVGNKTELLNFLLS